MDDKGEVLDVLIQRRRNKAAAVRLLRKLVQTLGIAPKSVATGRLASYSTALRGKGLLPATHLVGTGYLDAKLLVATRRDFGSDPAGPARTNESWQAREGKGFAAADFHVNWEREKGDLPPGRRRRELDAGPRQPRHRGDQGQVRRLGLRRVPAPGGLQHGTRPRRTLRLRTHEQHITLVGARRREATAEFAALSALRAGMEGTISQAVRGFGLRRSRYIGQAKTHLQHVATAAAMNRPG